MCVFRSVFENLIEKQFPAPSRELFEGSPKTKKRFALRSRSPSPQKVRESGSAMKRRVLTRLNSQHSSKRPRIVYSDESDDEQMDVDNRSDDDKKSRASNDKKMSGS